MKQKPIIYLLIFGAVILYCANVFIHAYSNVLGELYSTYRTEFIDALYDMIINLREEGVI